MKRSWTALAVALITILAAAGCNDYGNTFQNNTGASVRFLSPSNVSAGSPDFVLTVNGGGFVAKTFVEWNGKKLDTTINYDSTGTTSFRSALPFRRAGSQARQPPQSSRKIHSMARATTVCRIPVTFIINPPPNPVPTLTSIAPRPSRLAEPLAPISLLILQGSNFLDIE